MAEKKEFETGLKEILKDKFGVESLKDAVQKARNNNPIIEEIAAQVSEEEEAMRKAIKEVEDELKEIDIETIDKGARARIGRMPMNTVAQVEAWRDEWIRVLRGDW